MFITKDLERALRAVGAKDNDLASLKDKSKLAKVTVTLEVTTKQYMDGEVHLRSNDFYEIITTVNKSSKPRFLFLKITIELKPFFKTGCYQRNGNKNPSDKEEHFALVDVEGINLKVVMWRYSLKPGHGTMAFAKWREAVMRGKLVRISG